VNVFWVLAGVPRSALVILAGAFATFHLPMEGVGVLLGVDALLDMTRTSIKVLGNCLASATVARWEGVELGSGEEIAKPSVQASA